MEPPMNRHKSNKASNLVTEFLRAKRTSKRSALRSAKSVNKTVGDRRRVNLKFQPRQPPIPLESLSKGNNGQPPCAGPSQATPTLRDISACDSGCADEFPPGWVRDSFNSMRLFVSAPQ